MACQPCEDKKKVKTTPYMTCSCGLARILPTGLKVGDSFTLQPCPICGSPVSGTFEGDRVELR